MDKNQACISIYFVSYQENRDTNGISNCQTILNSYILDQCHMTLMLKSVKLIKYSIDIFLYTGKNKFQFKYYKANFS